jgi:hypothetical protein
VKREANCRKVEKARKQTQTIVKAMALALAKDIAKAKEKLKVLLWRV